MEMQSLSLSSLIQVLGLLGVLYLLCKTVHTLFLSQLAKVPGPWIRKITRLPYIIDLINGTTVRATETLHRKYGPVVQLSPTDVSFISIESAWPQIYGFRTGSLRGHAHHPKDQVWIGPKTFGVDSVIRAHLDNHSRQRKLLSHAFSERALSLQEEMLQSYVDKLIEGMRKTSVETGDYINMVEYYNWTTFDIIGDLTFGHSFGNLDDLRTHSHISNLLKNILSFSQAYMKFYYPITKLLSKFTSDVAAGQKAYWDWIAKQTDDRIARETARPDFMTFIMQHNGEKGDALTNAEIKSNASLLVTAGSETTATLLSGVTWLLLKNPDVMNRLRKELHEQFPTYEDITMSAVAKSTYLLAVLDEGLRFYPPVPTGFPRVIAEGGEIVSDYYMPQGTSVCVSSYAAHHSPRNFTDPDKFEPERWLGNPKYANDKQHDIQPFSFGPHACLGKNLAYAEMRLILAKVIWSYDLKMDDSAIDWLENNRVFFLWKKPALPVRVSEATRPGR